MFAHQSFLKTAAWLVLVPFLTLPPLAAQDGTATISGTVKDPAGAFVPGAAIEVQQVQTGARRPGTTNDEGRYSISDLAIGEYSIKFQKEGFQSQVRSGVTLTVGSHPVIDFQVQVGQAAQSVTVVGDATLVDTNSNQVASLVDQRQIRELPLNGRNFEQLILLAPGAQPVGAVTQNAGYGRNPSFSITGTRPSGQEYRLDGQDIQSFWGHGAGNPMTGNSLGVDAIAEYQTITSTYGAQFGGSGAVVNAVTKSGTNSIHGSAFEFIRNSALDALNYFDNPTKPPAFRRNQFGFTLGGPIRRNKTFFFANYEGFRQALGTTTINTVPDANAHKGLINGVQFTVNPVIAPYLALFPACSPEGQAFPVSGTCQLITTNRTTTFENYVTSRVDHRFSDKDSLFVRYTYDKGSYTNPLAFTVVPGWPELDAAKAQYLSLGETRLLRATIVNTFRADFSRTAPSATDPGNNPLLQFFGGRPNGRITVTGIAGLGNNFPLYYFQNKFGLSDTIFLKKGSHDIQLGVEVKRVQSNFSQPNSFAGAFTFQGLPTFIQNQALRVAASPVGRDTSERGIREIQIFPFIQDNWKVSARLTLNLGLRYGFHTNPVEVNNLLSAVIDPASTAGFVPVPHVFVSNPSLKNFDPRAGIVWDPFANHKTAVRAAFGIFHDVITPREYLSSYTNSLPFILATQNNPVFPAVFGASVTPPVSSIQYGMDYRTTTTPYIMQYNLFVEREIFEHTVLTVGYAGSKGVHLFMPQNLNAPVAILTNGVYTIAAPTRPANPSLGGLALARTIASSHYNGLQVSLKRAFSHNVQSQIAYTYSKLMDNGSVSGAGFEGQVANVGFSSNPYTLAADYSRSAWDLTHNFVNNTLVVLPFHGNKFVEGWQLSMIGTLHTGFPFSVGNGVQVADQIYTNGQERPNVLPGFTNDKIYVRTAKQWFNPLAFSEPAPGTFGNLGRNTLIGPHTINFDAGILKTIALPKVSEAFAVQIRAEMFNLANHPNFGLPTATIFTTQPIVLANGTVQNGTRNPNAGIITSTSTTARQMQFALKVTF